MKRCTKCNVKKADVMFSIDPSKIDGRYSSCKACKIKQMRKKRRSGGILARSTRKRLLALRKTRICGNCHKRYPLKMFHRCVKNPLGRHYVCRTCSASAHHKRYIVHSDTMKIRARTAYYKKAHIKQNLRAKFIHLAGGKCVQCGVRAFTELPAVCFDFHHKIKHDKSFTISRKIYLDNVIDEEILRKEIDKCVLLCANCHRTIHYGGTYNGTQSI